MVAFLTSWGTEILFTITSVVLGLVIKHFWAEAKRYKQIAEEQEIKDIETQISNAIQPLKDQLNAIQKDNQNKIDAALIPIRTQVTRLELEIKDTRAEELKHLESIRMAYRYRLIVLCQRYLHQGFMTTDQYKQLTEMYKVYSALGGNGQAKEIFDKTCQLQIKDDDEE